MTLAEVIPPQQSEELESSYDPKKIEDLVRTRWRTMQLRDRISAHLKDKKKKGYVEGPPTLNGEPHLGHLRGRLMKDLWFRYETMRGTHIDFRGGWDTQGLPVELQAEKELGLTGNKTANLKLIGEEKLVEACKEMISKYHKAWHDADVLLGLLIDDEKAYYTLRDEFIEREWQVLRAASDQGILEESFRVTPFCPSCQTPLSASEVALGGYENVEDPSMYFKMKIRDKDVNTFLIAWTTMPFTVVTDELVGVKPNSEYCYVSVPTTEGRNETWLVGKERLDDMMKELHLEKFQIKNTLKGKDLEGTRYDHPLASVIPLQKEYDEKTTSVHSIVAEEFVDTSTGSGLVHMSPANGEDDFDVARRRNVPVFNPIDGEAKFTKDGGPVFAGLFVRDADEKVRDALKEGGSLLRYGRLKHEYPICWRSGHRLVWLARREYYYFVDRLGNKAVDAASKVEYFYDAPKNRFLEIIKEKHPWCISRERFWGTPLPIWKCSSCGKKLGLFSRQEILERASDLPDGENFELHRPWIDRVVIECPDCDENMIREPFVLDTWHNSGSAPYSSFSDGEYKEYVPVPFLTEGIDQTRGWAYTLLIENVILQRRDVSPYDAFLFQGLVLDEKGSKMSKSKGTPTPASELLREKSVDVVRLYLIWKGSPIDSINFSYKELDTRPYQIVNTLYHMHVFYLQNSRFDHFELDLKTVEKTLRSERKKLAKQDAWLLSRLEFLVAFSTGAYSQAKYHEAARALEQFLIEDLSQTYVPIIRGEMWQEDDEGKRRRNTIYNVLGFALLTCSKILHPITPYLTDYLASEAFGIKALTLEGWPGSMPEMRDEKLEVEFDLLSKLVSLTNSARMKGKLKRRWPLRKAQYLVSKDSKDLILANKSLLLEQCNVGDLSLEDDPSNLPLTVSAKLNLELVAPRAKRSLSDLQARIEASDPVSLYNQMGDKGKVTLGDFELGPADLQFFFSSPEEKTVVAENYGMVVALDAKRDDALIASGLVKDLARNLQALRKQKGYNPTDVLGSAKVAGLGEQNLAYLKSKESEIAFLVRAKEVRLYSDLPPESSKWEEVDIDGAKVKIDIA